MKRLTARVYVTIAGNSPVRDWLLSLNETDRNIVGKDMYKVEAGWLLGSDAFSSDRAQAVNVIVSIEIGSCCS